MNADAVILAKAVGYWPHQPIAAETAATYADALKAYDPGELAKAFDHHARDEARGRFFPAVSDLLAHLRAIEAERIMGASRLAIAAPAEGDEPVLSADPIRRSQEIWALVVACCAAGRGIGGLPDKRITHRAMVDSGAYRFVPGSKPAMIEPNTSRNPPWLTPWCDRHHGAFRQAYCRAYGVERDLGELSPTVRARR